MEGYMKLGRGEIPQKMIDMMSAGDRAALGLVSTVDVEREVAVKVGKLVDRAEAEIQREVEGWLRLQGYWPRTPEYLDGRVPPRGWYVHLSPKGTKNNPILLDLVVLGLDGRYLEVELKTQTGAVRDGQAAILKSSGVLCRSSVEAIEVLRGWMDGKV
jgi:hypothetical protein